MPTYEYACPKCGHHFDQFQSMKDVPLKRCPKCKKLGLKRLIGGGAGLIFKGSGFYITDYKKKSGSPDGGETKLPAGDTKSATAEGKPAAGEKVVGSAKPSGGDAQGPPGAKPAVGGAKSSEKN